MEGKPEARRLPSSGTSKSALSHPRQNRTTASQLTYKMLSKMPLNLRKKAIREARNRNEKILGKRRKRQQKKSINFESRSSNQLCMDFERSEHNAMLNATQEELRHILKNCKELSDIPDDSNQLELFGEIAKAEGLATTIYVQRDGLDTLTVVLHQSEPTIAQLKKAIAELSLVQHKRRQRERHEERCLRRHREESRRQQVKCVVDVDDDDDEVDGAIAPHSSTGELVHSVPRNGHKHRTFVSWRFLWRCFALYNVDTNQPINDQTNGRIKLNDLGIKNASTLKFVHRIKYFGRQRQ